MASPVHVQHIAKRELRLAAKLEIVDLTAHNKGMHKRRSGSHSEQQSVSIHRAMLAAMHSMHEPTSMQIHDAGRSCA